MNAQNELRKQCNIQGGALLIYRVIMNAAVFAVAFAAALIRVFPMISAGIPDGIDADEWIGKMVQDVIAESGWGYFLAIAIGMLILLLWKKRAFFRQTVLKRGKAMTAGSFFSVLSLFMSAQLLSQLMAMAMEALLRPFGVSVMEFLEKNSVGTDSLSMFLYVGLGAPIFEEILFRGLVMRSLEPYGRKFAIIMSAVLFGLYHGNLLQSVYATAAGVILGYVAMEYNVLWAMVLHMFNNLVFADTIPRLLERLPGAGAEWIQWGLILLFSVAALAVVIGKRHQIAQSWRRERILEWQMRAFFCSPCMLLLIGACGLYMFIFNLMMLFA